MSECFGRCNETVTRDEELARKDAEIARLRAALELLSDELRWKKEAVIYGAFTCSRMVQIARDALAVNE